LGRSEFRLADLRTEEINLKSKNRIKMIERNSS